MGCRGDYKKYLREDIKRLQRKLEDEKDPRIKNYTRQAIKVKENRLGKTWNHKEFGGQTLANYSFDDIIDMSL